MATDHAFHLLAIADIRPETEDTVSLGLDVPPGLRTAYRFAPGQHITFRVRLDGAEVRRSYSICSGVDEGELRVAVKLFPGGEFSTWVREQAAVGGPVEVMPPSGRFTVPLRPEAARQYLGIVAGSGITPVISILKSVLACERRSRFTLVYGNRGVSSIIFREQLDDLKNRYLDRLQVLHVLSREHQDVPLLNGRITGEKLRALCRTLIDLDDIDETFLCGPEPMTLELRDTLLDLAADPRHVHLELFGTPVTTAAPAPSQTAEEVDLRHVTVVQNGVKVELDLPAWKPVLDGALDAGLDLPFSCKGGVCATCRARVCEGKVDMAVNYALEPWEVDDGFVLTCQSRVVSESVVVDYDQA
jgi:ring-1,2-phenylacetyl-CoA epoxidase subunit PaaE